MVVFQTEKFPLHFSGCFLFWPTSSLLWPHLCHISHKSGVIPSVDNHQLLGRRGGGWGGSWFLWPSTPTPTLFGQHHSLTNNIIGKLCVIYINYFCGASDIYISSNGSCLCMQVHILHWFLGYNFYISFLLQVSWLACFSSLSNIPRWVWEILFPSRDPTSLLDSIV